jgi:SAM-dependent methyltransferase
VVDEWTWDETLFAGAAPYYERGRYPYAPGLADGLRDALHLDGRGRLLDIGCGPGTVTLRFAPLFEEALGLDADAGMIEEAKRIAARDGIRNASWVHMRGEDLPGNLGRFRVITFAASLHWMDRAKVFATVRRMVEPDGAVVHVDNAHQDGVQPGAGAPHPPRPSEAIDALVKRYLGPDRRAGQSIRNTSPAGEDDIFRSVGFSGPERVRVPDGRLIARTIDEEVALTLSASHSAPHLFGDRLDAFVSDLRDLLAGASPSGKFSARLPDNELKIWRPRVHLITLRGIRAVDAPGEYDVTFDTDEGEVVMRARCEVNLITGLRIDIDQTIDSQSIYWAIGAFHRGRLGWAGRDDEGPLAP